jgi:hypothetical protein
MKKHKFTHSHIEHHKDGTHTVHHVHEEGPHKDVKGAAHNHDAMMDHMMEHTSAPNPGEGNDVANAPMASPAPAAGAPPMAPPQGA